MENATPIAKSEPGATVDVDASVDLAAVPSVVLRRLIAEVRDEAAGPVRYDRTYTRHNR